MQLQHQQNILRQCSLSMLRNLFDMWDLHREGGRNPRKKEMKSSLIYKHEELAQQKVLTVTRTLYTVVNVNLKQRAATKLPRMG